MNIQVRTPKRVRTRHILEQVTLILQAAHTPEIRVIKKNDDTSGGS